MTPDGPMNAAERAESIRATRRAEDSRRADLLAHLSEAHGIRPGAGRSDLQLSHRHAVAHLSPADEAHVLGKVTGNTDAPVRP